MQFRGLPLSLKVMLITMALVPGFAYFFVNWPDAGFNYWVVLITYFVFPPVLVFCILIQNILFLPFALLEGLGFVTHSIALPENPDTNLQVIRYVLVAVMTLAGALIINRDILFPFMTKGKRKFRGAQRIYGNLKLKLKTEQKSVSVLLENCSYSGFGVSGRNDSLAKLLKEKTKGSQVSVVYKDKGTSFEIPCELVWQGTQGPVRAVGLRSLDSGLAETLFHIVCDSQASPRSLTKLLTHLWVKSAFRRATLLAWTISMVGALAVPACGDSLTGELSENSQEDRRLSKESFAKKKDGVRIPVENATLKIVLADSELHLSGDVYPEMKVSCNGKRVGIIEEFSLQLPERSLCSLSFEAITAKGETYVADQAFGLTVDFGNVQDTVAVVTALEPGTSYHSDEGTLTIGLLEDGRLSLDFTSP
jgi:hypothetical protein